MKKTEIFLVLVFEALVSLFFIYLLLLVSSKKIPGTKISEDCFPNCGGCKIGGSEKQVSDKSI